MCLRLFALAGVALAALRPAEAGYGGQGPTAQEAAWVRAHVGMYAWGPGREEEWLGWDRAALSDIAGRLGARIIRSHLGMFPEPWRLEYDPLAPTYVDRLRRPEWRALIARNDVVLLTLGDGSGRQLEPEWTREQTRRLTAYLLTAYADVPKTFVLGLWECDHWLTEDAMARDPSLVETYAHFFEARHQGIAAGRAEVPRSRARVLEMIELVTLDYEGKGRLVNRIVPGTHADLYSLSSWGYQYELGKALDYIKTKAPDSRVFGRRNCMIGEAGGPANWAPPAERVEKTRAILAQARRWGVPYVTWWELVGGIGEGQISLRTPPYEGGAKLATHYWFHRAYHERDDPLVVEDFEEDPYGPAGGDVSEEGYSLNVLGGRREVQGEADACLVPGGSGGGRSLHLRFGRAGGRWSTGLMHLDARRFTELRLALRGPAGARVALRDGRGRERGVTVAPAPAAQSLAWHTVRVPLQRFPSIDQGDLNYLAVSAAPGSELRLDDVAFIRAAPLTPRTRGAPPSLAIADCRLPIGTSPVGVRVGRGTARSGSPRVRGDRGASPPIGNRQSAIANVTGSPRVRGDRGVSPPIGNRQSAIANVTGSPRVRGVGGAPPPICNRQSAIANVTGSPRVRGVGGAPPPIGNRQSAIANPQAVHLALRRGDQHLPVPDAGTGRLAWLRLRTAQGVRLPGPALTDGQTILRLGMELLPGEVLEVVPGGTSHLRFGPLGPLLDVRHPEAVGLQAHNLDGHPQFHSLQPAGDGSDCRLEWEWESPYPVRHFRIALYGNARAGTPARATIDYRGDGAEWQSAALDERSWDEGWWVGRPPTSFQPATRFRVRFRLLPDRSLPDWPWTVGLSDVRIDLWLDTDNCRAPLLRGLRYRDDRPEAGYRGLLDLDW